MPMVNPGLVDNLAILILFLSWHGSGEMVYEALMVQR